MYEKNCIKITLDTCAIELENPIINELMNFREQGLVKLFVEIYSELEKEKWTNIKREADLHWITRYCHQDPGAFTLPPNVDIVRAIENARGYTFEDEINTDLKIRKIHSPEIKNIGSLPPGKSGLGKYSDWQILTNHIMNKRDYFLTKNTRDFINKGRQMGLRRKLLENQFPGLKIREPDQEFIKEIKEELKKRNLNKE